MSYATFNKEIVRAVTGSWGRFLAIFAIAALGVGFYSGLMMTAPDMDRAADAFYDDTDLMDIRIVSTMGLTADDLKAISEVEGVGEVMGAYETDVVADIHDEPYAVRVHSLAEESDVYADGRSYAEDSGSDSSTCGESGKDAGAAGSSPWSGDASDGDPHGYINKISLAEGRWPEKAGECLISADRVMNTPVSVGDKLTLTEGTTDLSEVLAATEYTVVGLAHSSYYTSPTSMGTTSLGTGRIQQFMYVLPEDFAADYPYTETFVTVSGARALGSYTEEYDALVADVMARVEGIAGAREQARRDGLVADAQQELGDARAEYETKRADAEAELADAKAKLDDASAQISSNERKLADAQKSYDAGAAELASQRKAAEARLAEAASTLAQTRQTLDGSAAELAAKRAELEAAAPLMPPEQYEQAKQALDAAQLQLGEGFASLEEGERELAQERAAATAQMDAAASKLADAKRQIAQGRAQLAQGRADYDRGIADYDAARAEADAEFASAEARLADAQADIDAIGMPEWLVMDRTKNYGAESFSQDAGRISNIAKVFPLIFFLVAALVALTTMTRMVDEERMLIGTYKALGYSRSRISSKYILYALTASLGGSIVGIAVLAFALPAIIMHAYAIIYIVPIASLAIDWPIAIGATALGVGITLAATWAAVASTLRESPAALMLPKAPKAGHRILLERVRPLWRRLSFLWKVTCRNLFRYKKRMVMTVIGIAGCTALLLTGFGLRDSINDIIDVQFGEIIHYNTTVVLKDDATEEERGELSRLLDEEGAVSRQAAVMEHNMAAIGPEKNYSLPVTVPEDAEAFAALHTLREREGHRALTLPDDGAVITEKLGTLIGAGPGDVIELAECDSMGNATADCVQVCVVGLAENYIDGAVYMSPAYYAEVFGNDAAEALSYDTLLLDSGLDEGGRDRLAADARELEAVKTLSYNDETIDSYRTMLGSVNMVVYVLIVAAALLAFIVLYNLTNINITERMREIATLKVLGFTQREVQHYIFREIVVLSLIGALAGLAPGVFLENFVVVTAEVEAVMFGRTIHASSFVLAFVLTMLFTWVVTLFMRGKLARVDMVESLKSNE